MKFDIEAAAKAAEVLTLWPAVILGVFWLDGKETVDLIHLFILLISGSISYTYLVRVRRTYPRNEPRANSTPGEVNPLYLLSEGTLLDFIEVWRPGDASVLPRSTRSVVVLLTSLSIVITSFILLWIRSSWYIVTAPEPNDAIIALGILPYLLVGVLVVSAIWTNGVADSRD